MDPTASLWLNYIFRWLHVLAGIAWIGSSFFFMFMDSSFEKNDKENSEGTLWMVHGGGFYFVEKLYLKHGELPKHLHWFKWEAYFTWITGFFLLGIVYYMGGAVFLIDPSVEWMTPKIAAMIGLGLLIGGWGIYDMIWRSPIGKNTKLTAAVCLVLLFGVIYGLTQIYSGRGAFIHVGALIGTLMAGNVVMNIIPGQRKMVKSIENNTPIDYSLGKDAKKRSVHNNYLTLPLIFIMISNHYPMTFGNEMNWLVLCGLIVVGAGVRHFMNVSDVSGKIALGVALLTLGATFSITMPKRVEKSVNASAENNVKFHQVRTVINNRCLACHSATPSDDIFVIAPGGVMFDTPKQIKTLANKIKTQAVVSKAMPLGNKTNITEEERALIGKWVDQGADITK